MNNRYLSEISFDEMPERMRVRAFGVQYARMADSKGGLLYVTRHGWPWHTHLHPDVWYANGRYHKEGQRLTGGTGTVYRLMLTEPDEPRVELVVKISRFAEFVPLFMPSTLPTNLPDDLAAQATFNSPFEEFGLIEEMRRGHYGPPGLRILSKRPLAIYCGPARHKLWQLGRTERRFHEYDQAMRADQADVEEAEQVNLDIERQYIMLFGWVRGENAEDLQIAGELSDEEVEHLTERVNNELARKGFRILDNKPKHFILRRRADGSLARRNGELVYVQVDFELLQRTDAYRAFRAGPEGAESLKPGGR